MRFHLPRGPLVLAGVLALINLHCSVFRPVGDLISDGYENTVAYFNSYYNAARIFDEAEREVLDHERTVRMRQGLVDRHVDPPASAKAKFSTVIDKCSNILSFQPRSALVDDALLLIGKSYFYQGEFVKAERKFIELLSLDLSESLSLEARLWKLKTLAKLGRDEEVREEGTHLAADAVRNGEEDIVGEVWMMVGQARARNGEFEGAITAFENARNESEDEDLQGAAQFLLADALAQQGKKELAADAYLKVREYSDIGELFLPAGLRGLEMLREAEAYDRCLEVAELLREDYRFQGRLSYIDLETGRVLRALGRTKEAMDIFVRLDTTNAKTEVGVQAAFEQGTMYEERGDYRSAQAAYTRATTYPVPVVATEARRKASAFDRYHALLAARAIRDTLMDKLASGKADSSFGPGAKDSLLALQAVNAYEIAELFYADLGAEDSARTWYSIAVRGLADSVRVPRACYILAELTPDHADSLLSRVLEYPGSPYAPLAASRLGMQPEPERIDPASGLYAEIEGQIESGDYASAVRRLRALMRDHAESPYAAKSLYALGWLYEHRLGRPDSALLCYTTVMERYGNTRFAQAVRDRLEPRSKQQPLELKETVPDEKLRREEQTRPRPTGREIR
ncbi:MAG: tetratricopeptide repeat protein [Ignavibacterium sp.]|jgi:tetratricopeptide (TPR) repeat protein